MSFRASFWKIFARKLAGTSRAAAISRNSTGVPNGLAAKARRPSIAYALSRPSFIWTAPESKDRLTPLVTARCIPVKLVENSQRIAHLCQALFRKIRNGGPFFPITGAAAPFRRLPHGGTAGVTFRSHAATSDLFPVKIYFLLSSIVTFASSPAFTVTSLEIFPRVSCQISIFCAPAGTFAILNAPDASVAAI